MQTGIGKNSTDHQLPESGDWQIVVRTWIDVSGENIRAERQPRNYDRNDWET